MKHEHLLVRADVLKPITKKRKAKKFLRKLIKKIRMKKLFGPVARYCKIKGNRGITAFAIIETSHIALHIWDEKTPATLQLDIYSCSEFNPRTIFDCIDELIPVKLNYKFLDRENEFNEINT